MLNPLTLRPQPDDQGTCPENSYYVSCNSTDAGKLFGCDASGGYTTRGAACESKSVGNCPIDTKQFLPCSFTPPPPVSNTPDANPIIPITNSLNSENIVSTLKYFVVITLITLLVVKLVK